MVRTSARIPAATAVLRRALAHRAFRRLLVLAGLVTAGWLIGGAGQAFADTAAPVPADTAQARHGLLPASADAGASHGLIRDASEALGGRSSVPTALTRAPRGGAILPLPGRPALKIPASTPSGQPVPGGGRTTPGGPVTGGGTPGDTRPGTVSGTGSGTVSNDVATSPDRPARTAPHAAHAARTITRPSGGTAAKGSGHARRNVSRTVRHGSHTPVAPVAPAPAPAQAGSLAPVAGPVLFGGLGGVFLRRVWTPRGPKAVLVRASAERSPAVLGATDEPSIAPD
ncbi:hypothetical protein [Actinomadura gamaensis]|uniref:Uncharacterized protein n=1 Tax=Actinomadura gamaensis TaxID=1763541 RepID=A0ABV9U9M1_9ACTN